MLAERLPLTREQIAQAEKRGSFSHPVIEVIQKQLPQIKPLIEEYSKIEDTQEQQRFIRQNYGFLADALVATEPFTLQSLDIVAIWSRVMEIFSGYQRYALAGMISGVYAIQGLEDSAWKKFPRHCLETGEIPPELREDKSSLAYLKQRLDHIGESLEELDFYVYGTREAPMKPVVALARRIDQGDKEAQKELDGLISYQKSHSAPVLAAIHENFSNGLIPLYFSLRP